MSLELSDTGVAELFAAFAKAQASMGDVLKQANNPAFRSKYADLASVVEAVTPALNANGLAMIQAPSFDGEVVGVETVIAHTAGGFMRSTFRIRPAKADAHGLGSAVTYARRYALMAVCGVAPEDDDGNAASGDGPGGQRFTPVSAPAKSAHQARKDGKWLELEAALHMAETVSELDAACARLKVSHYDQLPPSWQRQADALYDKLKEDLAANSAGLDAAADRLVAA